MKNGILALAAFLFVATAAAASHAESHGDAALSAALEKVSKDQIAAFNREDATATLGYAYTKSPAYDVAKGELAALFAEADAKAEQISFRFIGHDDEFAIARVKVKVTADAPDFQNNVVDALMIFHTEDGAWKVWDSYLLGGELVK